MTFHFIKHKLLKLRFVLILQLAILFVSCASNKIENEDDTVHIPPPNINCPSGGDCSFEVMKNSSLNLLYDDSGIMYPKINAGENIVVKYRYKKDEQEGAVDDSYSEYVYLEFKESDRQLILKDKELQNVKMIFGRICYCKGEMGYFKVKQGSLFLFNASGNLQLRSTFKVGKIPQIITQIEESINY